MATAAATTIPPSTPPSTATAATATFTGMNRCSSSSTSRRRRRSSSKNNDEDADDDDDTTNNSSATDRNHSWLIISSNKDNNNNHNNNNHHNTNNTNVPPEYRLAYRYVVATANNYNNNRKGDSNDSYKKATTKRRQQQEQRVEPQTPVVLFCNGFRSVSVASSSSSSAEGGGTKVQAVERYCTQHALDFCCFDYRGHGGLSSGKFDDMTLSDWIEDTQNILTHVVLPTTKAGKKTQQPRKVILVGASMGVWIALHIASFYNTNNSNHNKFNNDNDNENNNSSCNQPQRIIISGILGIAAAPDFIHDLWLQHCNHHTNKQQRHREEKGRLHDSKHDNDDDNDNDNDCIHIVSRYEESGYTIKFKLVKDAIQNWILLPSSRTAIRNGTATKHLARAAAGVMSKIAPIHSTVVNCRVHLLHGKDDQEISWKKSVELSNLLSTQHNNSSNNSNNATVLELIPDGDHRLSRPQDIQLILEALQSMI